MENMEPTKEDVREIPESFENIEKPKNLNSISELMSFTQDLETSPDKVYRSVRDMNAIKDLFESGVVRNGFSAGAGRERKWGDRVFWSKGREGAYHMVTKEGFVLEAPLDVASDRQVTQEDITAIYTKNEEGKVMDVFSHLKEEEIKKGEEGDHLKKVEVQKKLDDVRKRLGI